MKKIPSIHSRRRGVWRFRTGVWLPTFGLVGVLFAVLLLSGHFMRVTAQTPVTLPSFAPSADAKINASSPTTNYGAGTALTVRSSGPTENFLMKFNVSGIGTWSVQSAILYLYTTNASDFGGDFYRVSDNSWTENGVTWSNAPPSVLPAVASLGPVLLDQTYQVNLTSFITGDGTYSLRVSSTSTDGAGYASKEDTTLVPDKRPRLEVIIEDTSPPSGVGNVSPLNNATGVSLTPTLTAATATDATLPVSYYFVLYQSSDCSGTTVERPYDTSNTWSLSTLTDNTTYSWKNRARDNVSPPNESAFSACTTFTTLQSMGTAIRSLAISRRPGGRGANLVTNPGFEADRGDAGGKHYADGWQSSSSYTNARGNIAAYTSFLDPSGFAPGSTTAGTGKAYIGESWQSIGGVKSEALGNGLFVTSFGLNSGSFPADSSGTANLTTTFGEDLTPKILEASGLQSSSSSGSPFEIGTIISGYVKIPNTANPKTYEFQVDQGGAAPGRVSFNIENDVDNRACEGGSQNGSSCTTQAQRDACTNGGGRCVDRTSFPTVTSSPSTTSSAISWGVGTCGNSTLSPAPQCFDDSECFRGTCIGTIPPTSCVNDNNCGGAVGSCEFWTDVNPTSPLCQNESAPVAVSQTAVTFPANGGIKAKECVSGTNNGTSCTTNNQCTGGGTCQVVSSGWYPFAIQYYQPWTPRCSNNPSTPCVKDADCGSGNLCQIGKWCVSGSLNKACFNDTDCGGGSNSCQYAPLPNTPQSFFTLKYKGTCSNDATKACRQSSDCGGVSCKIETDLPSLLKFQYKVQGAPSWTDVSGANLLSPTPNLPQSEVAQEIPLSLLPGTAYRISGKYKVEFTDQFDLYSSADPRWNARPHAGVMTRCKNSSTGGNCGYELNLFQTDRVYGVGSGKCENDLSVSCQTNQECKPPNQATDKGTCVGDWQNFSAVVTKRNYNNSGNPAANDAGQTLEVVCFADVGAKIACDEISVIPENEAAVNAFDTIDVWAVGDQDTNGAVVYRNTLNVQGGVQPDNWFLQKPPVLASLTSITAADPYHFWAVGQAPVGEKAAILRLSPANVTGWAWIGASTAGADPIGWIDFNCGNQGTCAAQPLSFGVSVNDSNTHGQCANNLAKSCKVATDCGGAACVTGVISGSAWFGSQDPGETVDFGPCTSPSSDSCNSLGQCTNDSARLCSASTSLCWGTCSKNQGFRCKMTDSSDCKISCSDNPLACRSSGWLSFDKGVAGTPPRAPYNDPNQNYIARFDYATDAIEGWARLQFGKCAGGSNDGLACFQDSDCGGGTCDYSNAPSRLSNSEAGWVKLRGDASLTSPVNSTFVSCRDCTTNAGPNAVQSCKICTDAALTSTKPACNACSSCTARLCPDKTTGCSSNTDCGGAKCKTAGICSGTPANTKCFTDADCGAALGICTNLGGTCSSCSQCSAYGVSIDAGVTKQLSGSAWSPDFGWMDFGALRLGGQLFFATQFGSIYAGGDIGSPTTTPAPGFPGGTEGFCNATYRIIAKGTITNFCSNAQPAPLAGTTFDPQQSPYIYPQYPAPFIFPSAQNRYTSQIGTVDLDGLTTLVTSGANPRNKYGNLVVVVEGSVLNSVADDINLSTDVPGMECNTSSCQKKLLEKVYHIKGNLVIDKDYLFDVARSSTENGSGTFIIEGRLILKANLSYYDPRSDQNPPSLSDRRQLPSVAFLAKDWIEIDSAVASLVGVYYTEKTIDVQTSVGSDPDMALTVSGLMVARNFELKRRYVDPNGVSPAELVIYDGRLQANTPPGLEFLSKGLPNVQEFAP